MNDSKTNINWYPGHMAKTRRQIIEDLKIVDIVIELLDARIPISSQNPDIAEIIKEKKKIVVLNKCDLADEKENQKWLAYFENKNIPAVLVDSNSVKGIDNVVKKIEKVMEEEKEKQAEKGRVGRKIRAMILGIPNVGKSSFINRISKRTTAEVGNKPGVTKKKQWIRINEKVELLDTPGVLWPKFEDQTVALNLASLTAIKEEVLPIYDVVSHILITLFKYYPKTLSERYGIEEIDMEDLVPTLDLIGKRRGCIMRGGEIDYDRVMGLILQDVKEGRIKVITFDRYDDLNQE